ncbi:ATP synthase subunit I [Alteromonas gilva]|uniref:ATP synthase subunit I n=1 Tax=Alteromonas gilva TaxID=2987522 RepID=A0ABT5KWL6_9ALTE|nr:ATP synthase subunit I [Alteromonas gilva]MDC8829173.1 ATP synthase subunit I [Alteromonas gilva]
MTNNLADNGKSLAKKAALFQCASAIIFILLTWVISTVDIAVAVAAGTLISIIPNQIFALFAFRYAGASQMRRVTKSFSQGSKLKLAATVILFAIAFAGLKLAPLPVFAGFAIAIVSYWLALFRLR